MFRDEGVIDRSLSHLWWVVLLTGIAWLVVAWLVLRLNVTSLTTVGVLLGIVFLAAGANEAAASGLVPGGWKFWHIVMAVIFFLGGLWALIRPVNTFFALASVLGLILIFYGAFEIARSIAMHGLTPYWWIGLVTGILLILLAFWVSGSDRVYSLARRTYLILFWVGFMALFKGIAQIMLAFSMRHVWKSLNPSD
jgi:uncharacterized membrane protein HdeD (DUF308 family)